MGITLSTTPGPRSSANGDTIDYLESHGKYRLCKWTNGGPTPVAEANAATPHGFKGWTIFIDHSSIAFHVSGQKIIEASDSTKSGNWYLSLWSWPGSVSLFDNIVVTQYADPVVSVPGPITKDATGPSGAVVTFSVSAVDGRDQPLATTCTHAFGATFPIGSTTVTCSATDGGGRTGSASFSITVAGKPPSAPLNLVAETGEGLGAVDLAWDKPQNLFGFALLTYRVDVGEVGDATLVGETSDRTFTATDCALLVSCHYFVRAVSVSGEGEASNEAGARGTGLNVNPGPGLHANPDGSSTLYNDQNGNGQMDRGEDVATIPPLP